VGTDELSLSPSLELLLTFQMHNTVPGHEMHDRAKVGFKFAADLPDQEFFATA